jgi:hypothetical protein
MPSAECLMPCAECLMPSAECLMPSAECLMPSAKCLMPCAECIMPSAECLMPSAECLIPSAECLMPCAGCLSVQGIQRCSPLSAVRESTQLTAPRGHRIRPVLLQAFKGCAQFYYAHCESALSVSVCAQQKNVTTHNKHLQRVLARAVKEAAFKNTNFCLPILPKDMLYYFFT